MNNKTTLFLTLIVSAAVLLRSAGIFSRPIWYDEAFSILLAGEGPGTILESAAANSADSSAAEEHPPLYYFCLWAWFKVFGNSIASARMFSIFVSTATIIVIYRISGMLFNNRQTALYAAALTAILPFQIHFGQEIRMYAFLNIWLLLAVWSFLHARHGNWKWWLPFTMASALAQYTHNLAAVFLVPLALTPLFQRDWKTLRALTLAGVAAMILYLPWMLQLPAQFSKVSASYWVTKPGVERIFTLILFYLPHLPLPGIALPVGLLAAVLTIALTAFQTWLGWKEKTPSVNRALWIAYLAFTPPTVLWLVSQIVPVYIERALLSAHAMFCIWLAWAFTQTKLPRLAQIFAAGMILLSAGLGIYQHVTYSGFPYAPYTEINQSLAERVTAGDVIIHSSKLSYLPAFYDDPTLPQGFIIDPPGSGIDTLAPATREALNVREFANIESASADAERVWFIIFKPSIEEYTAQGLATHPHLEYLESQFTLSSVEDWDDIQVYLFVQP
jgi:4-amino-4-deoxy-L-arabinose transferase-like glycosyltransferase